MWCPEGYFTLGELMRIMEHDMFDRISPAKNRPSTEDEEAAPFGDNHADLPDATELQAYHNWLLLSLIETRKDAIRACLNTGNIVRLNSDALRWVVTRKHGLKDVNPLIAPIARWMGGDFPDDYGLRQDIASVRFANLVRIGYVVSISPSSKYGAAPIGGASLCIKDVDLPAAPERLTNWLVDNAWKDSFLNSDGRATSGADIVEAFKTGRIKTKADAHRMFGQDMKHLAWLALWKEAVSIVPSLAKPEPRSG